MPLTPVPAASKNTHQLHQELIVKVLTFEAGHLARPPMLPQVLKKALPFPVEGVSASSQTQIWVSPWHFDRYSKDPDVMIWSAHPTAWGSDC